MAFVDVHEVLDYLVDKLRDNANALGIKRAVYGDPSLILDYPAIVCTGEPTTTELHATRTFQHTFRVSLFVYHAKLTVDRETRTREDLLLVAAIRALLHDDFSLGQNIIFGYVESIAPGTVTRANSDTIIGSRMVWTGKSQERF